ncbi:MAG: hypothetical protein ACK587_00905, partial [Cyanobacteriota bacterium]
MALSFAGEDRPRVAPIADALASRWGRRRILYDHFHGAEFARPNLDVYLPRLYRDESELIVVVLSPDYPNKAWCGLEFRWIRSLILDGDPSRILLLTLGNPGDLSSHGLLRSDGTLDVSDLNPDEVCALIEERLEQMGEQIRKQMGKPLEASGVPVEPAKPMEPLKPEGTARPAWREEREERGERGEREEREAPEARLGKPLKGAGAPDGAEKLWWSTRWRRRAFAATAVALALPLAWLGVRGALARWQLSRGDAAFLAFVEVPSDERLQRAAGAWWWARWLDPSQAAPHARLGYLADVLNDPQAAETHWSSAIEHEAPNTPAFRAYRTGLALSLGRQPARRAEAIKLHEANDRQPRAAMELAMLHWDQPAELSRVA